MSAPHTLLARYVHATRSASYHVKKCLICIRFPRGRGYGRGLPRACPGRCGAARSPRGPGAGGLGRSEGSRAGEWEGGGGEDAPLYHPISLPVNILLRVCRINDVHEGCYLVMMCVRQGESGRHATPRHHHCEWKREGKLL